MGLALAQIAPHLLAALVAGAVVGIERSFNGRPAGFRTHALVALASSVLMVITVYQGLWFASSETMRIDPTRMAQGIMTGIGFLGAGVIFKEGLTVRGLTTAASIWTTAAIGILMGTGLYGAGALATALTLGILSTFRRLEDSLPLNVYGLAIVRFARDATPPEAEVQRLVTVHGFRVLSLSYQVDDRDQTMEYRIAIRSLRPAGFAPLAESLRADSRVRGFTVAPSTAD
jgi:putative Mg2+ transporter-C (MgtC) family protein